MASPAGVPVLEPRDGAGKAVLEGDLRAPAELAGSQAGIGERQADVPGARVGVLPVGAPAEDRLQRADELVDGHRPPAGDVGDLAAGMGAGGGRGDAVGRDDVGDVGEVAGLLAVAVDYDGFS